MANLTASLLSAGGTLDAYTQALGVVQNNVANASTPGFAAQSQTFDPLEFNPNEGFPGGVQAGQVVSSRNEYAEQAVQQQTTLQGQAQQDVNSLTSMQSLFDVTGSSGIATAFNNLFSAFSAWGQTPDSSVAQQNVIEQANAVASAFQQTATGLDTVAQNTQQQLQSTVAEINQFSSQLAGFNQKIMNGDRNDPGLDAQIHTTLDQLSNDGSISASQQADGTWTVLLNGQTPLVMGQQVFALTAGTVAPAAGSANPNAPPQLSVLAYDGRDITASTTAGQLGSILNLANHVLPGYMGDGTQPGSLNTLAQSFAGTVNNLLTAGYQSSGPPPVAGVPLFTFNNTNATNVAQTLQVSSSITPDQLAAISPGPPAVSNGVPLALSQLASPTTSTGEINGLSYTQFYAGMASNVGTLLDNANSNLQTQQAAVAQAQSVRQQLSGVSLDQEATILIQFQQAYEANSKFISVLDQLTEDTMNMLPNT
ncbi:MAG TPA: flagellar hook-associated protein FlgK [Bryobacteraceae bacterium]|jgi:flagellar hook-associated protein 1 FlgK|nr:flagellar hook-associated protein FlgK [Bryobacteraceae bacterium]